MKNRVQSGQRQLGSHPHLPRPGSAKAGPSGHIFTAPFVLASIIFLALGLCAQTTNGLSAAEIQGRQLAAEILSETPVTNFTQTGVLRIHNSGGTTNIPVTFKTEVPGGNLPGSWDVVYTATPSDDPAAAENLIILHQNGGPNIYCLGPGPVGHLHPMPGLSPSQIMAPFAGSDFWIADLGLEFFHWPDQTVTGHETRRMRACAVLESINPNPDNGYSRVVTWIDNETLGIIYAEAFDTNNKLLKVFEPKSLKKVNGQWELQNIEIRNVQTHSRTWIRFDLNGKS